MGVGFELVGMGQLLATLEELGPRTRVKVEHAVNASTIEAKVVAQTLSPVDTGYLKSRWQVRAVGGAGDIIWNELYNDAFYAGYVIFGTRKMAARDCLTPAIQYGRQRLTRRLAAIKIID